MVVSTPKTGCVPMAYLVWAWVLGRTFYVPDKWGFTPFLYPYAKLARCITAKRIAYDINFLPYTLLY